MLLSGQTLPGFEPASHEHRISFTTVLPEFGWSEDGWKGNIVKKLSLRISKVKAGWFRDGRRGKDIGVHSAYNKSEKSSKG